MIFPLDSLVLCLPYLFIHKVSESFSGKGPHDVACVAGVQGEGEKRGGGLPRTPLASRAPFPFPFPFLALATQATHDAAGTYPGFYSMRRLRKSILPLDGILFHRSVTSPEVRFLVPI